MSDDELHYLRSILRNLREFRAVCDGEGSMLGHEVLADNIDWLDCFVDRHVRTIKETTGKEI